MISSTAKKVGIIAAVVLVLGAGGFAASFVISNSSDEETEAEQTEEVEEDAEETEDTEAAEDAEEDTDADEATEEVSEEAEEEDDAPEGYESCDTNTAYQVLRSWTWTDADESTSVTFMVQYFTVTQDGESEKWAYRITNAYKNSSTGAMIIEGLYEAWTGEDFDWDGATSFTIETRGPSDTELEELGCSVVLESDIFDVTLYDNVESAIADILAAVEALNSSE